ncbi:CAP domain-containing protein [Chachezhania antarctica]|uniref:CAP domain-containing protein n=1 Tax=Chachezhania antarctica TaxID=2340860 RepID=UPI000EABF4B1|nr:CAP domain-containing protein [Chachezhania antarctica]
MARIALLLIIPLLALTACGVGGSGDVYRIRAGDTSEVQYRMLDGVNALRNAAGAQPLQLNAQLTSAAQSHSRDMASQQRPWHFGSDGSSPLDRVARAGYPGRLLGENISETYETELETLGAWTQEPGSKRVIMDPAAQDMGFGWHQESNGKIWWTLITGTTGAGIQVTSGTIVDPTATAQGDPLVILPGPTRPAG